MKYGWSRYTVYGRDSVVYRVQLWKQPWRRWLTWRLYHWYDMHCSKLPGWRAFERWQMRRHEDEFAYIPWGCRQDIRCYDLMVLQRTTLLDTEVTKEESDSLARS